MGHASLQARSMSLMCTASSDLGKRSLRKSFNLNSAVVLPHQGEHVQNERQDLRTSLRDIL